jgi:NADH-quinone oxidoreductase subunit C
MTEPTDTTDATDTSAEQPIEPSGTGGTRHDMFGASGFGDTSGFGGLVVRPPQLLSSPKPYGEWFDDATTALEEAYPAFSDAIERVVVHRGELTLYVKRESLLELVSTLRDDPKLRFEMCASVSGVDYLDDPTGRRLHSVYHLLSMTYRRRIRLEVSVSAEDPHIPSVTEVYPTANWHERETWDFFGIVFDGHPGLTRIEMPDDWPGHPQRKDYPLGGVPVEYKGATVPPPDERRSYA